MLKTEEETQKAKQEKIISSSGNFVRCCALLKQVKAVSSALGDSHALLELFFQELTNVRHIISWLPQANEPTREPHQRNLLTKTRHATNRGSP